MECWSVILGTGYIYRYEDSILRALTNEGCLFLNGYTHTHTHTQIHEHTLGRNKSTFHGVFNALSFVIFEFNTLTLKDSKWETLREYCTFTN